MGVAELDDQVAAEFALKWRKGLATRLRNLRHQSTLTQNEASQRSGVHEVDISRLENGHNENPSVDTLLRLAWAYKVPLHYLFMSDEPGQSKAP